MSASRITLKLATSLDGRIATATGESRWITGEESRLEVHQLRAEAQAVIVGIETALADDPELTVRLDGQDFDNAGGHGCGNKSRVQTTVGLHPRNGVAGHGANGGKLAAEQGLAVRLDRKGVEDGATVTEETP